MNSPSASRRVRKEGGSSSTGRERSILPLSTVDGRPPKKKGPSLEKDEKGGIPAPEEKRGRETQIFLDKEGEPITTRKGPPHATGERSRGKKGGGRSGRIRRLVTCKK